MDMQKTPAALARISAQLAGPRLAVLRGLLSSVIVFSLPQGAGIALIALVSAPSWREVLALAREDVAKRPGTTTTPSLMPIS